MIPVVLIHMGNNPYIYNTLYQLKQTNPLVKVYLIGTYESVMYGPLAEHIPIETLFSEAEIFAGVYKHFSTNSVDFERICIQRWFVLKAFMNLKNIERCLYLDSDVLVYEDVQRLSETYAHAGMTLCGISGHTNFIDKEVLVDFCKFLLDSYTDKNLLNQLEKHYIAFVAKHGAGGVSDMTLLTNYAEKNPQKVENTYCFTGLPTLDPSLEVGEQYFEMEHGKKKVIFKDRMPYGLLKQGQKEVLFYTLHFQGAASKKIMQKYIPIKSFLFWIKYVTYTGIYYWQKLKKKFV